MPKGPFIDGSSRFLDCANFENVACLSKGCFLYNVAKIGLNCNIKIRSWEIKFQFATLIQIFF